MFVAVTLLLPRGIVGTMRHVFALRRERNAVAREAAANGVPESTPRPAE
jgi:hypothetical protein